LKEWAAEKKKGLEEVAELRQKVAEAAIELTAKEESVGPRSPTAEYKMEVEDKVGEEPLPEELPSEKERVAPAMDTEDTIEY